MLNATVHQVDRDSPTSNSEHAVDDLLPTAMENTPLVDTLPLPLIDSEPNCGSVSNSQLEDGTKEGVVVRKATPPTDTAAQPQPASTSSIGSQDSGPRSEVLNMARSALMDVFQKVVQLRFPTSTINRDNLNSKISQRLTDVDVQDFMRIGKVVIDDLKRTGKLEEAKRRLGIQEENDEEKARRVKRRLNPSSPPLVELLPSTEPQNASYSQTNECKMPIVPSATITNEGMNGQTTEQPGEKNTSVTVDNSIIRETLISSKPGDDVSMSMSIESLCSPQTLIALDSGNIEGSVPFSSSLCPSEPNPTAAHADEQPNIHGTEGQDALPEPAPSALVDVRVPRILLAKVGASAPSLMDASFELDDRLVAAVRRHPRPSDPDDLHMRLYLTCIPAIAAEKAHRDLPPNSTPSSLAECVSQIDVTWPPPGTFYVSLNEDGPGTASYTDKFFGSASPPLDISNAVLPGTNTIRFIQLADLSQRIFLILTILVNEEEAKRRSNPIKVRFMP